MILHTVNKSPLQHGALDSCLQFMNAADVILLLEDGVFAALANANCGLERAPGLIYAISADVHARGLQDRLAERIELIDYGGFVDLCVKSTAVKNWS